MGISKFHHVAFRCNDARETIQFYTEVLGLRYSHAVSNDIVGSTREFSPHIHIFLEMPDGSSIAFFEVPMSPPAEKDPNTPRWVQHVAFEMPDADAFDAGCRKLEAAGLNYLGPIVHGDPTEKSVYFFDPNGHRLELHLPGTGPVIGSGPAAVLDAWDSRKATGELAPMQ